MPTPGSTSKTFGLCSTTRGSTIERLLESLDIVLKYGIFSYF